MNATDLVIELVNKINSLKIDLDCAKYNNEKLKDERVTLEETIKVLGDTISMLEAENKTLKLKIDDMSKEF